MLPGPEAGPQPALDWHDEALPGFLREVGRRLPEFLGYQVLYEDRHHVLVAFELSDLGLVGPYPFVQLVLHVLLRSDPSVQDEDRGFQLPLLHLGVGDGVVGRAGDVLQVGLQGAEPVHQVAPVARHRIQDRRAADPEGQVVGLQQDSRPHARDVDVDGQLLDPPPELDHLGGHLVGLHPAQGGLGLGSLDGLPGRRDPGLLEGHCVVQGVQCV